MKNSDIEVEATLIFSVEDVEKVKKWVKLKGYTYIRDGEYCDALTAAALAGVVDPEVGITSCDQSACACLVGGAGRVGRFWK